MKESQRPLASAGLMLGIGMGGFLDGIVFHQLLQLHNMLTGRIPKDTIANIEINMFWDGVFHLATWSITAAGIWMLFRVAERGTARLSPRTLLGAAAAGWGLFNFVEGLLDHHLLGLHHVVERYGLSIFDWAFLASGILLMAGGWYAMRSDPAYDDLSF